MTTKYRVVVEVLSLKTLDVEVSGSSPEDAKKVVKSTLDDYGTSAESLVMIQDDEQDRGLCFRMKLVSEAVSVKEAEVIQEEDDFLLPGALQAMGIG
jgi:hypothetical protein